MGLVVTRLRLVDFRSFREFEFEPSPGTTILVGPNASGKTNTVEALQLLTAAASFRGATPAQLVREGAEVARASAHIEGDGRVLDVALDVRPGHRQWSRNGKRCQGADVAGTLLSVLFSPDDLSLVKGAASLRRAEVDGFARQAARGYANLLQAYQRAVEQRNRLLREPEPDLALLDAWDASVARGGATLLGARTRLFARLAPRVEEAYGRISGGEGLSCTYVCSLGPEALTLGRDELTELMCERLLAGREEDLRRQRTGVGPHRDDVLLEVAGRDARAFASQGQQRSVALAFKVAEVVLAEEVTGTRPLLLLDDVMSELDAARREAVMGLAGQGIQMVVTTTNLGYFSPEVIGAAKVVSFGEK